MCGISGIINLKGFESQNIKKINDLISHRGPDDEGYILFDDKYHLPVCLGGKSTPKDVFSADIQYKPIKEIEDYKIQNTKIAFGHRRLSILDLSSAGHQPMSYAKGRFWTVFNGEIYNYLEIKKELLELGYSFISDSDTEVIIAAYQQWGAECQHKFNGMWAFVIYDCQNAEIFMSRDRFGIKPLYYWFAPDGSFCFASEIKQFTVFPGWEARLNPQRAYDYLIYSYTDHTEETMFAGVNQIPGGHYYKARTEDIKASDDTKIITVKWYQLTQKSFNGTFEQAATKFEELFRSSVDLHLRADVPVGSALSGGLDSSAIVCEVNNILKKKGAVHFQKTFSSCSLDERYDEKRWMDIVVKHTNVDAHFVYPRLEDVFEITPNLTWYHDEPYQSQSAFLSYHVFELAKLNKVKVLLNGQGADEYLGGYGQFAIPRYANMFRKIHWANMIREIENSREYKPVNYPNILRSILSILTPSFIKKPLTSKFGHYNKIKSLIDNKCLGALSLNPFDTIPMNCGTIHEISKQMIFFNTLPKYLKWEDRNSMANSVEARVPFLDYRLVEFTYNLPDNYLDYGGQTKRVLREGLKDILPEKIRSRKDKKGFITPEERWVKEDDPELFRLKLKEAIEISNGIIKPNALLYFDKVVAGKVPFDYTYWRLIQFAEWMQLFDIKN